VDCVIGTVLFGFFYRWEGLGIRDLFRYEVLRGARVRGMVELSISCVKVCVGLCNGRHCYPGDGKCACANDNDRTVRQDPYRRRAFCGSLEWLFYVAVHEHGQGYCDGEDDQGSADADGVSVAEFHVVDQ